VLENKLKQVALNAAVDISLRRMKKSPERCTRNLLELGLSAYPDQLSKAESNELSQKLLTVCKHGEYQEARELFFNTFTKNQA
jgi:hypothetical protein